MWTFSLALLLIGLVVSVATGHNNAAALALGLLGAFVMLRLGAACNS